MKKLLVLFPGVGYSTARPLLYYAKRMGQEKGYEVLELEYHNMPEHPFEDLKETAQTVCACAEAWAKHVDWQQYEKIAFVSKSVGTVAAGYLTFRLNESDDWAQLVESVDGERLAKSADHEPLSESVDCGLALKTGGCAQIVNLFLTPIEPTLQYLTGEKTDDKTGFSAGASEIVFSGTADQWMEPELLADFCRKHGIEHHAYAGGNHSIETGHVLRDVEIAKEIVEFYEKLL